MIYIEKIKWRNFMSWGNDWNCLDFTNGAGTITLIAGRNGAGKSSLSNGVVSFALYGKLSEVPLSEIPNRINGNTETVIEISAPSGRYRIERGLKPSYLRVFLNEKEITIAGKNNIEKWLVEEVYGLTQTMFESMIALSVNTFKSLLTYTPKDRRDVFDNLFGYGALNKISQQCKEMKKEILSGIQETETELTSKRSYLRAIQESDIYKSEHTEEEVEEKKKEAGYCSEESQKKLEEAQACEKKISEIEKKYSAWKLTKQKLEITLKNDSETLDVYNSGKCPVCGSSLEDEEHLNKKKELEEKIAECKRQIEKGKNIDEKYEKVSKELKEKLNTANEEAFTLRVKATSANNEIRQYLAEIHNAKEAQEKKETSIASCQEKIKEAEEKHSKLQKRNEILDKAIFLCSDSGIKKIIAERYIPAFNSFIEETSEKLSVPVKVEFDNKYECLIKHLGNEIAFNSLSTGERKKTSIATLLAFIKLIKAISAGGSNILFLDEVFSSLDIESVDALLYILHGFAKENNMNIFVIHHAPINTEFIENTITVSKTNSFSSMQYN